MDQETELRKLPPGPVFTLSLMLDGGEWKELMANIPADPANLASNELKYSVEDMMLIQSHGDRTGKSFTTILFEEWGTSGRKRPTLGVLFNVLIKTELFRAADYVAELLEMSPPDRPPTGPAAVVNVSEINFDTNIVHMSFELLKHITDNFDDTAYRKNNGSIVGHKLGSGAFGSVYYAVLPNGVEVAVKKLQNDTMALLKQFQTEIESLSSYRHDNLLTLLGYSCDADYCLVYAFMPNGSLLDRIADNPNLLNFRTRIDIALGACQGLHHLHTFRTTPLIHRDVKSANILLDENFTPKLGDFGLVKIKPNTSESKFLTSTIFGTSAYMAPEAFRGDISVKMDVFSVGVVMLELLTGLPPYDENRDGCDLLTFVEDSVEESIEPLRDLRCSGWDLGIADKMFSVARLCLEDKRKRPYIDYVINYLEELVNTSSA